MNEELVKKAQSAIDENRLDEGDTEMLQMVLQQYEKFPESKRIEGTIRELIKRTRMSVELTETELAGIEQDADILHNVIGCYPHLSVPTKKNRNYESIRNALIKAFKENKKAA